MKINSGGDRRLVSLPLFPSPRTWGALGALVPLCALSLGEVAAAQNGPRPGAPVIAPPAAPVPVVRPELAGFNILIIAFDDAVLKTPMAGVDVPPPAAPAITPGADAPDAGTVPGAMAPAAIAPAAGAHQRVRWVASAKQKEDPDAALFRPEPDPRALTPQPGQNLPPMTNVQSPPGADSAMAPRTGTPVGNAQLSALPLRRSLLAMGFGDVMPTAPDGSTIVRALGERRLTPRVVDDLRQSLLQLTRATAAPNPATLQTGIKAAARIGQAVGYRVVIGLATSPGQDGATAYSLLLVDSMREQGEPLLFDQKGADEISVRETAGSTGAALVEKAVRVWPAVNASDRAALAANHLAAARAAQAAGNIPVAQDELNQALSLDPQRSELYVMLGDLLQNTDPVAAAAAYRRAVDLDARDGATWAKISVAYTTAKVPDWPRALEAGRKALSLGTDTVALRTAMATAQFGRAELFRKADRLDRAEDAEFDARQHLDKALELAPDDPAVIRLLTKQLVNQGRYDEAVQTLDRVAPRFPNDLDIQLQYANALSHLPGREEDAFVATARVWKLSGLKSVDVDAVNYRSLAEGFDNRLYNLGKSAAQITTGVANAALPRESALLQLTKLKEDMSNANDAINTMRPPRSIPNDVRDARVFAADLMNQSLENHQTYLETGQDIFRVRGLELYRQAVAQLNMARGR
jgi:tetratricopeptide (TPR) repeat protein